MAGRARSTNLMDDKDIRALRKVARIYGQDVDLDLFLHGLLRQGFITRRKYETLFEIFNNITTPLTNRYEAYLRELAQFMTLQNIVSVFNDIGLQVIAQAILKERYCQPAKQVQSAKWENQDLMEKLYGMLLQKLSYGRTHVNMHVDFQDMTSYFMSKLQQTANMRKRQRFIDCLAVVVRIRGFILESRSENEAILDELMSVKERHKDLDHTITKALYLIAKVYIARDNICLEEGEAYIVDVKQVCHHHEHASLRALIYTAEQAFYRGIFSETFDVKYQQKSLLACDNAIYALVSMPNMLGFGWKCILLISKVFTLMAFGTHFKIDHSRRLKQADIEGSRAILGLLRPNYLFLGNKEKLMYHLCLARVYEVENSKLALSNVLLAIEMQSSAHITAQERNALDAYSEFLKSMI